MRSPKKCFRNSLPQKFRLTLHDFFQTESGSLLEERQDVFIKLMNPTDCL